jgi:hypothetical protein
MLIRKVEGCFQTFVTQLSLTSNKGRDIWIAYFLNWYSGGGGGVQLGPLGTAATNGLLCQIRVIMMMEKLVE